MGKDGGLIGAVVFDDVARRLFGSRTLQKSSLALFRKAIQVWVADGVYDPSIYESCLKEMYGSSHRLFDAPSNGVSAAKYAVTATTISDASTVVLTNYNGIPVKDDARDYQILRPDDVEDEVHIWEAYVIPKDLTSPLG